MGLSQRIKRYIRYLLRNTKTDSIAFKVSVETDYTEDPEGFPWEHTDIIINNKSLFDKLYDYESSEDSRTKTNAGLAGKYIGIDPHDLVKILKKGNTDCLSTWQCSICRSSLCATSLVCKYRVNPFTVEFYDFRQQPNPVPFNNQKMHQETLAKCKWNYAAFGPFRFNKTAFFKELAKLA